jgi:hypothetical protein
MSPAPDLRALHIQAVVRGKLAAAISYNVKELVKMEDGTPLAIAAWHGRNLLELLIWTEYCIKSPENAMRFALDAIRDLDDLLNLITEDELKTVTPEDKQRFENMKAARAELTNEDVEPEDLSERYTSVRTAARAIGKLSFYEKSMKAFSKCAHPTALLVMMRTPSDDVLNSARIGMTKVALQMADEANKMGLAFGEELRSQLTALSAKGLSAV